MDKNILLLDIIKNHAFAHDFKILQLILNNQIALINKLDNNNRSIFISSRYVKSGSKEHYYHFVFDLLFPLSFLIKRIPEHIIFEFHHFGPMTDHLKELLGDRIHILGPNIVKETPIKLIGLNPSILKKCHLNFNVL